MPKNTYIFTTVLLILGIIWIISGPTLGDRGAGGASEASATLNESGEQVVNIFARGGFSPKSVSATQGVATILNVETKGTYDCSSVLSIPKLDYYQNLKPTGIETIAIPAEKATGTIDVLCGMGMYRSEIIFK